MLSTFHSTWTSEIYTCVSSLVFPWPWTQHPLHPSAFKRLPMMLCSLFRDPPRSPAPSPRSWWSGPTRSRVWFLVWGAWWSPPRPGPSRSWAGPDRACMWPRLPPQERTLLQYCQRERDGEHMNTSKARWDSRDGATASDSTAISQKHHFCIDYMYHLY